MTLEDIQTICRKLKGVTQDIKWEDHVCFSVGGKMFLITSPDAIPISASVKVSEQTFDELSEREGFMPAPYLAYSYKTDGGGIRFREATNPRRVGGILIQDYINYKPEDESIPVDSLKPMFIEGRLQKLSEIKLENVNVKSFDQRDK